MGIGLPDPVITITVRGKKRPEKGARQLVREACNLGHCWYETGKVGPDPTNPKAINVELHVHHSWTTHTPEFLWEVASKRLKKDKSLCDSVKAAHTLGGINAVRRLVESWMPPMFQVTIGFAE